MEWSVSNLNRFCCPNLDSQFILLPQITFYKLLESDMSVTVNLKNCVFRFLVKIW